MPNPPDQELSFDPRSWVATRPAPAAIAMPDPPAARAATGGATRPGWVAPTIGIAIAVAGAIAALSSRPAIPPLPVAAPAIVPRNAASESRTLIVPKVADLGPTLAASGVSTADSKAAVRAIDEAIGSAPGDIRLAFTLDHDGDAIRLAGLTATRTDGSGVKLVPQVGGSFGVTSVASNLRRQTRFVRGELDGESFYSSAVAAGVSDVLIGPFVNAFRYDFDMQREVARGDVFEAGFEQRFTTDGEPVGTPMLVYASLATAGKSRALYRYRAPGDAEEEWFDSSGRSSRKSLMRTPVEAARISSGFGLRGHPILGFVKMHKGTDFAAPTGTPIYAAGDAVVTFAGPKGPNGNFVRLHHASGWDTLYLHMNRIAAGLMPGLKVAQGQQIGEVGTTGRSTGPHLHYEVHIDGQPVDPMSIEVGGSRTLAGAALKQFRTSRDRVDAARVMVPG
jgi:murein DD-endopeptidase MepM/ murein hydrolase activator NlpD